MKTMLRTLVILSMLVAAEAVAAPGMAAVTVTPASDGGETWSLNIQILAMMTALSLLPAALITMTSFTRIIIVLAILRQALGTAQTPSNQILIGLSLFLTLFVMSPVFGKIYNEGIKPYLDETITPSEALQKSASPLRSFMLEQTRETDLGMFADIGNYQEDSLQSPETVPFSLLVPAYVTSELKTAFQIGFLVLIPFLVIDLVVASVLMSLGMMMLPPVFVSLPFKLLLFVLVGGWSLVVETLLASYM